MVAAVPKLIRDSNPAWHNPKSFNLNLVAVGLFKDSMLLQGSAAELRVTKQQKGEGWILEWGICSAYSEVKGKVYLDRHEFQAAFGLSDTLFDKQNHSDWWTVKYGADVGYQGKFIRLRDMLNIPGPGTGLDGDPNISIYVTAKIQDAVSSLLKCDG